MGYIVIGVGLIAVFVEKLPLAYWLIFVGVFLAWWGIRSPARRLKNYYRRSVTNEQIVAQIDENGVTTASPTGRSEMKWVGFAYVLETPKTFSLYTIGNIMFVFPKRAFNEQSCNEFRKLTAQNGIATKPR